MNFIDLPDPSRVNRKPDKTHTLFESGNFTQDGFLLKKVILRYYLEKTDPKLGSYSLITSYVETDKGSVEMIYDEGFRGEDNLDRTVSFLVSNLGISALIQRSLIAIQEHLDNENT